MEDFASWFALVATCIAAILTASNLGPRTTGWGFVIFAAGAVAWIVVASTTGQTQLLYSNIFLAAVDVFGVWRWLGRRAKISDASSAEETASAQGGTGSLFSMANLDGRPVVTRDGETVGTVADALVSCDGGVVSHLVVRTGGFGGVGERLVRLSWSDVEVVDGDVVTGLDRPAMERLATVKA